MDLQGLISDGYKLLSFLILLVPLGIQTDAPLHKKNCVPLAELCNATTAVKLGVVVVTLILIRSSLFITSYWPTVFVFIIKKLLKGQQSILLITAAKGVYFSYLHCNYIKVLQMCVGGLPFRRLLQKLFQDSHRFLFFTKVLVYFLFQVVWGKVTFIFSVTVTLLRDVCMGVVLWVHFKK